MEAAVTAGWVAESVAGASPGCRRRLFSTLVPPRPDPSCICPVVSHALGIIRNDETLREAAAALLSIAANNEAASDPAVVALMIAIAALRREESRGSHYRSDFPGRDADACPSGLTLHTATGRGRARLASTETEHLICNHSHPLPSK
ncbi:MULTISPECIES: hypothetical protein [Mesorhizobium]|uniref:hypothetical protein n=1 Tax=Rhizobium loti TaxID=381 RepID=UPI0007EC57FD|nr:MULTISPECIES: hypothetical protein [Mesorhizobium]